MPHHYYIFLNSGRHLNTVEAAGDAEFFQTLHHAAKGFMYVRIYTDNPHSTYAHIDTCDIHPETRARTLPEKKE